MSKLSWVLFRRIITKQQSRDIVSGMDAAEMEEFFHGECEEDYHPFKNGGIELD
jgi:hypothetical protein